MPSSSETRRLVRYKLASVDAGIHAEIVGARAQRHHHLLERGVTGTFADSVDGAFHLAGAVQHAGERIRHRQPQIVVAVNADGRPVRCRGTCSRMLRISAPYCSGTV